MHVGGGRRHRWIVSGYYGRVAWRNLGRALRIRERCLRLSSMHSRVFYLVVLTPIDPSMLDLSTLYSTAPPNPL